jgi:hypothetical protein
MEQTNQPTERVPDEPLPWWVRLAFPLGVGKRRYVLRDFWFFLIGGTVLGVLFGGRVLLSEDWRPYWWCLIAYFAVVGIFFIVEWQAIRWMDRSKRWPE